MLRSARLIENSVKDGFDVQPDFSDAAYAYRECLDAMEIQPGDTMTGWEIIAGLPLEDQQNKETDGILINCCPASNFGLKEYDCSDCEFPNKPCRECWNDALSSLYRWNGESWEVADEKGAD